MDNIVGESIKRNYIGLLDSGDQVYRPNIIILYNGAILAGDVHPVTLFRSYLLHTAWYHYQLLLVNFLADELISYHPLPYIGVTLQYRLLFS
jgi:hypothetical protein